MKKKQHPLKKEKVQQTPQENNANRRTIPPRKRLGTLGIMILSGIGLAGLSLLVIFVLVPLIKYNQATKLLNEKQYDEAITIFESLGDYKDAPQMVQESTYQKAGDLLNQGKFDEAIAIFTDLGDFKDSREMIKESNYLKAKELLLQEEYEDAITLFGNLLDYKDSTEWQKEAKYLLAKQYQENGEYYYASGLFAELGDYKDAAGLLKQSNYSLGVTYYQNGFFELALGLFAALPGYEESALYAGLTSAMLEIQGTWEKVTLTRHFVFIGWNYFVVDDPYGENRVTESKVKEEDVSAEEIKIATETTGFFINYDVKNNLFKTQFYSSGGIDHGGFDKKYYSSTDTDLYRKINSFTINTRILVIMEPEFSLLLVKFPYLLEQFPFLVDK